MAHHSNGSPADESTEEISDTESSYSYILLGDKPKPNASTTLPSRTEQEPVLAEHKPATMLPTPSVTEEPETSKPLYTGSSSVTDSSSAALTDAAVPATPSTRFNVDVDKVELKFVMQLRDLLKLKDQTVHQLEEAGFEEADDLLVLKRSAQYPNNLTFITRLRDRLAVEDYITQSGTLGSASPTASEIAPVPPEAISISTQQKDETVLELPVEPTAKTAADKEVRQQRESTSNRRSNMDSSRDNSFLTEVRLLLGLQSGTVRELADAGYDNVDDLLALHMSSVFPTNLEFITNGRDRAALADHVEKLTGSDGESVSGSYVDAEGSLHGSEAPAHTSTYSLLDTSSVKSDLPQTEAKEATLVSKSQPSCSALALRLKEFLGLTDNSVRELTDAGYDNMDDLYRLRKSSTFPANLTFVTRHRDRTALETFIMEGASAEQDAVSVSDTTVSENVSDRSGSRKNERPSHNQGRRGGAPEPRPHSPAADVTNVTNLMFPGLSVANAVQETHGVIKVAAEFFAHRLALGRNATLGDLYNIREDCLLASGNRATHRQSKISAELINRSLCKVTTNDSIHNKLNLFGVTHENGVDQIAPCSPEQALSILSGLNAVGESLKILFGPKFGREVVRGFLMFSSVKKRETLTLEREHVAYVLQKAASTSATHMVIGITSGHAGLCMVEAHASVDQSEFRGRLEEEFGRAARALVGGEDSFASAYIDGIQNIFFALNGRLQPRPRNVSEIVERLGVVSRDRSSDSPDSALPMELILAPLFLLHQVIYPGLPGVPFSFAVVADNLAGSYIELFDILTKTKEHTAEISRTLHKYSASFTAREISEIRERSSELDAAEVLLKNKLANILVKTRTGPSNSNELLTLPDKFLKGPFEYGSKKFSLLRLRKYLSEQTHVDKKLELLAELRQLNVAYLGRGASLETFAKQNGTKKMYVLFHTSSGRLQAPAVWQEAWQAAWDKLAALVQTNNETESDRQATFALVDCDVLHVPGVTGNSIAMYSGGKLLSNNVLEEGVDEAVICYAKSAAYEKEGKLGTPRCCVELPCPVSYMIGKCPAQTTPWHCAVCLEALQFCFDDYYYCSCGRAPIKSFAYKCGATGHGTSFSEYPAHRLRPLLAKLEPIRELNILILGETGVGKSTWINGFVNYVTYSTLEDAKEGKPVYLIPSKFTLMNQNYEATVVKMNSLDCSDDKKSTAGEERFDDGHSCTQYAKSYTFPGKKMLIRLIDTPGIGDTSGADVDRQNFKNILDHISRLKEIHGICILLKPNNARLTVMFQFCIKELLTHLHKDAARNITFVFTNTRGTFYRPGDTFPALKKLLEGVRPVEIPLTMDTMYCMDNEPVRFLAAVQNGIEFTEIDVENFSSSWLKSAEETGRLINYIASLEPHKTQGTLSLNEARRMILLLVKPMAEISNNIQTNIDLANDKRSEMDSNRLGKNELMDRLNVPILVLESRELPYPRTVCAAKCCIAMRDNIVQYVRQCHDHCYLKGVEAEKYPNPALKECAAMQTSRGVSCSVCGCGWEFHLHVRYEQIEVPTLQEDMTIRDLLRGKDGAIAAAQALIRKLDERIRQLNVEMQRIAQVSSKFAYFLKTNAITAYNDSMDEYLAHMIRLEHEKIAVGGSREKLEGYETMRARYHQERDILAKEMQNGTHTGVMELNPQKINELVTSLYNLPLNGRTFEDHVNVAVRSDRQHDQYRERNYMPAASAWTGRSRGRNMLQENFFAIGNLLSSVGGFFRRNSDLMNQSDFEQVGRCREPSHRDDYENDDCAPSRGNGGQRQWQERSNRRGGKRGGRRWIAY